MREAAVSRRVPRSRRCAPLNAGPFAVSCNVRIPKGFPATCVRSLPLPARKRDFRARSARRASEGGREALDCGDATRVPELCGRRCETNIYYPCGPGSIVRIFHQRDSLYSNTVLVGRYESQSRIKVASKLMGFAFGIGNSHE